MSYGPLLIAEVAELIFISNCSKGFEGSSVCL